jgi:hypothetical protein
MAADLTAFKAKFPELDFGNRPGATVTDISRADALLTAKLADAAAEVSRDIYATAALADLATLYLAAHLLACSPSGLAAKMVDSPHGDTIYYREYLRRANIACAGGFAA